MRKIGILSMLSPEGGGTFQYTLALLESLKLYGKSNEYIQIRFSDFPKILTNDIVIEKSKSSFMLKLRRLFYNYTGFQIGNIIPNISKDLISKIDLIISPIITPIPYYLKKPYIITIHDFQEKYYPEFFTIRQRISRKTVYKTGKFANMIIVESEYVKRDVINYLGIIKDKIRIIPSPPPLYLTEINLIDSRLKEIKEKYRLPDNYIFYPAQFWYHKNHIKLLEALNLIKQKYNEKIYLILVGSKQNNFENVINKIKNIDLKEQVKHLGYVSNEDMPYLYKLSTMLVMPTLFESISIPIWEAFFLGIPVVSSNVCALPEEVENAGLLFDPNNIEDMAEKILTVWTDENLRKKLIKKGFNRIKDLTLENYAKQWEKAIKEMLNSNCR